ncbi:MAG: helicase HerA-like domain-containing protein, partial [Mailhella sp.]
MLTSDKRILIAAVPPSSAAGTEKKELCMEVRMLNRHGLITGATGTGKTISLQNMAESFSAMGIPVLLTDVKGDLAAMARPGSPGGSIAARIEELHLHELGYGNKAYPVCFWDTFGQKGTPLRTTVSDMGPTLLSRLLELNDVQSSILNIIFRIADEKGLLLLDIKDLRAMLAWASENRSQFTREYGNISPASIGAIQRSLLRLEDDGAGAFFGEPALNMEDLFRTDINGRGMINILSADRMLQTPRIYASVLLWLLSELYERLPEQGDAPAPRLILMFDEAHLMFKDIPSVLMEKVEQVVRLIRSRG